MKVKIFDNKLTKVLLTITLIIVYAAHLTQSQDADMYWMIANGREILQHGILYSNPTSIVPLSLVNQQWLYCILIALFDKLGYIGHISFVLLQDIILVWLIYIILNKQIKNKSTSFILALGILLISNGYMINIRPQIITMCLLLAHVLVLDKSLENKNWLWFTPLITLLENNLHGAVVFYHIFIALPYMINNRKFNWPVIISAFSILPLSLLNPYGLDGALYTFKALFSSTFSYVSILDLNPLDIISVNAVGCLVAIFLFGCLLYKQKINKYMVTYMIIPFLCFHQIRNLSLITLPLIYLVAASYDDLRNISINKLTVWAGCGLMFLFILMSLSESGFDKRYEESSSTPYTLIDKIDKDANVFTEFDNGGYAQYMGCKHIFIDARPEIYLENDVLKDYSIFLRGYNPVNGQRYSFDEIEELLEKYDFDYILCSQYGMLSRFCEQSREYELLGEDKYTLLFVKK